MIHTQIEIAASPEECRSVFLDFENWSEIGSTMIRSISRLPKNKGGPVEVGEVLNVNFNGKLSPVVVLENTSGTFKWRGDFMYVFSGEHIFYFEPSKTTPGGTTFINDETPKRFNIIFLKLIPSTKMFYQVCADFKARVEKVKAKGNLQAELTA